MIGIKREPPDTSVEARGLGRLVEADPHLLSPQLHPCSRAMVHKDDRCVSVSWARNAMLGLHSVAVDYDREVVRVGVRMGTRPAFADRKGYVVLRVIIEHTVIKLREPLRGRRLEMVLPGGVLKRTS